MFDVATLDFDIKEGQFDDAEESNIQSKVNCLNVKFHEINVSSSENTGQKSDDIYSEIANNIDEDIENYDYDEENDDQNYDYDEENDDQNYEFLVNRNGEIYRIKDQKQYASNAQSQKFKLSTYQPSDKKYINRISIDKYEGPQLSGKVANHLAESARREDNKRIRKRDKKDRATVEQALDCRIKAILCKLMDRDYISDINGCISTGKEANVYHGSAGHSGSDSTDDKAIKIYKTSILKFKDREKYVVGDRRFCNAYPRKNPRKMVAKWAEKEMRNLSRMFKAGLPVPKPVVLRSHVLVMEFLGENGWPAPKLLDAPISVQEACHLYRECVINMWKMYNICKLVHADLSEFNILYHKNTIYFIDVSQAVGLEHSNALGFLRSDCKNITDFFFKKGVAVMSLKELFDFITDVSITETNMEKYLDEISERLINQKPRTNEELIDEEVFRQVYIPRALDEIVHVERDIEKLKSNEEELLYTKITGLSEYSSRNNDDKTNQSNSTCSSSCSESESDSEKKSKFINAARPRNETSEEKKLRKKEIKEEKAEKRKIKVKKHVKKRREKLQKANSKR